WAQRNGSGANNIVVGSGATQAANFALHIGFLSNNNFRFGFYANALDIAGLSDNLWHHWACVYQTGVPSGNNRFIYRDGVLAAADHSNSDFLETGTFFVGNQGFSSAPFSGNVDEVRVW